MPGLYKQGEGDNAGPDQSASSDKYDYIGSTDPNLSAAMLQAVSTQDANTIAAAIATYAPGVVNSTPFVITPKYQVTNPSSTGSQPAQPAEPAPAPAPAETTVPDTTTVDTQNAPI